MLTRRTMIIGGALSGLGLAVGCRRSRREADVPAESPSSPALPSGHLTVAEVTSLLIDSDRESLLARLAAEAGRGLPLGTVTAALLVAASRHIPTTQTFSKEQHALLVAFPAHRSARHLGWRGVLWAADYFKWALDAARAAGGTPWAAPRQLPGAGEGVAELTRALEEHDGERAEAAALSLYRSGERGNLVAALHRLGSRDFRHIGHKAIHVANGLQVLDATGWGQAEIVVRSIARTLALHYEADGHDPDSAWPANLRRLDAIGGGAPIASVGESVGEQAVPALLAALRSATPDEVSGEVVAWLNRGAAPQAIWDATLLSSAELLMNNPGAVEALHAVTASNAAHASYRACRDPRDRSLLLLQNAARVADFHRYVAWWNERRKTTAGRARIDELEAEPGSSLEAIFTDIGGEPAQRERAARRTLGLLSRAPARLDPLAAMAHRRGFVAAADSHDLKLADAVFADAPHIAPRWRARYVAACTARFRGRHEASSEAALRIEQLLDEHGVPEPRAA